MRTSRPTIDLSAAKSPGPEPVAQDDNGLAAGLVFVRTEHAADRWRDAEDIEEAIASRGRR